MSEVLASLKKKGGVGMDLLSPDVSWAQNLAYNATASISVTQKPRYIFMSVTQSGVDVNVFYDVINNTAKRCGYYGGGNKTMETYTTVTNYFPSVTSSAVTIQSPNAGTNPYCVNIYY